MKIALFDLNHMTRGVHTNTVPLGLGLISVYLEKSIGGNFEIKIFKDTQKALKDLSSSAIDIAGISQYSWNSELNLFIAKQPTGIYHVVGSSFVSDYEIATTAAEIFDLDATTMKQGSLEEFYVKRP